MFPSKILLQVSGSISCFKAAALASQLIKRGSEVQVVATASALRFVGEATFEGITSKKVLTEIFEADHMMDHIRLARWADAIILYPASANSINRLSLGLADDLIGALALSRNPHVPYFIAPAMNHRMWKHPATQNSVKTLSEWGLKIVEPQEGLLACGETGPGRLAEPEEMISKLESYFAPTPKPKVLITSGGTREPIDSVRFISNMSSGKTGATIAEAFLSAGFEVTYLAAQDAAQPEHRLNSALISKTFTDFQSLDRSLNELLSHQDYSAVIHAAAVSDYSLESIQQGSDNSTALSTMASPTRPIKLDSTSDLTLKLKKNFKILSRIKSYSKSSKILLIGFKLTVGNDSSDILSRIKKMNAEANPDFIVHNDLSQIHEGHHSGRIFQSEKAVREFTNKAELGAQLVEVVESSSFLEKKLNSKVFSSQEANI